MVSCSAFGCNNRSKKSTRRVGFHSFPARNPVLLKKWLDALQIKRIDVNKHCRVCSDHFLPGHYKRDLRHELIGTRSKRILREDAIPILQIPAAQRMEEVTSVPETAAHFAPEDFEPGLVCGKVKLKLDAIPSIFPDPNIIKLKKVRKKKSILCTTNYPKRSGWSFVPSPEHNMSGEAGSRDPLRDPLGADNDIDIIPEFEVKEEPVDDYDDVTDNGSPCWISDGVTLVDDNDDDVMEEADPLQPSGTDRVTMRDSKVEDVQNSTKTQNKGGSSKPRRTSRPPKRKKNFMMYDVGIEDYLDDDDDNLEVTIEDATAHDDIHELAWKNQQMNDNQMTLRRMELESHLTQCKLNIKVMQARLDEERGKMMRIQNSLVNLKRRQKRHDLKKIKRLQLKGNGHVSTNELEANMKVIEKESKKKMTFKGKEDFDKNPIMRLQMKEKMAKIREIKMKKLSEEKISGVVDYRKQLENKVRMARLREIKAQKALERKLNEDKLTPESQVKLDIKPMQIPKPAENMNAEDYEKYLESSLKMARSREIKAMKALERINNEEGDRNSDMEYKPRMKKTAVRKFKIKMNLHKNYNSGPSDEEMKVKMARLREIKAQKALERKKMDDGEGMVVIKTEKTENEPDESKEDLAEEDTETQESSAKSEENSKPEIHIATSNMLWNVLSRIKLEPYADNATEVETDSSSSYFASNSKKNPVPEEIPTLIKDFFFREDVSKVSTIAPNATPSDSSSVRYRMHYLPILHKQFEAENGNVCSYAMFCSNVPENIIKPHGWQWKFCPCLPCINPELKFEKMLSEGILKMEGVELGDILHDDAKENAIMIQLRTIREGSTQFFTYDFWERSPGGLNSAKRRTASEPIGTVITKFLEELSLLKSHIQRTFYQYHCAKLARDRGLQCTDEVTLHIECSPVSVCRNTDSNPATSEPTAVFSVLTGYLWSQSCEQALAAISDSKDYSTSGIWAGLEKILLSIAKAGKKKINVISDSPWNKYRNRTNFFYMKNFAQAYGVCFRWIFLEQCHQIGNADSIRETVDRTIKEQLRADPDVPLTKDNIQNMLLSHSSIIVDTFSNDDVQKYKGNIPKLHALQGTQKFDEVIILPEDFWVRDTIGFDTFKKLPM